MAQAVKLVDHAIISEAEAKAWASINQENIPEGDVLRILINSATENIEEFLNLEVVSRGLITELHSIRTAQIARVWLLQRPIIQISEVNNDPNRSFGASTVIPSTDYLVDAENGKITYVGAGGTFPIWFTMGLDVLQVKYWAGAKNTASVDWGMKSACMETVATYYNHISRQQFGVNSISDDQGNRTFMKFDFLPAAVEKRLYKRKKIMMARQSSHRLSVDSGTPAP